MNREAAVDFQIPAPLRRKLRLPQLGQVGFVVRDVDRTAAFYEEVLGLGPWVILEGDTVRCTNRGEAVTIRGRVGMAQIGPVQFELIQILEGESIHREALEEKGEGLHHLGFFVRDLEARLRACEQANIPVLQRGTLKQAGLTIEYAYLDTVATGGVIFEYIEPRLAGIPVKMRPWLMRGVSRLGSLRQRT